MAEKIIITAAVTGSTPTRELNPAIPYSPQEIAQSAIECWRAGAAIAHIHVRDPQTGAPELKLELFREVVDRIRSECDILVNLTTSGLHLSGQAADAANVIEKRLAPVTLRPDICSLDIGSVNIRDRVFLNPPGWGKVAAKRMRAYGVKPEIEVFDTGHLYQAVDLIERGLIDEPPWIQLCMGVKWGIAATPENLLFVKGKLPPGTRWSVLGVGRAQLPMITLGILLGGGIRVGFEDNLYLRRGVLAKSNAELVELAVGLVHHLQREIATPGEARDMLRIAR
jgi:3-keto-5-aminohexanoate cleavage enzyme